MPTRPGKACRVNGCSRVVTDHSNRGYCESHKDRAGWHNVERLKGNRHQRGYGSQWDRLRKQVLARDFNLCQACKAQRLHARATHVDHIVAKANGGTDDLSNLQSLCADCHKKKTATERLGRGGSKV